MARDSVRNTLRNTVIEYSIPEIKDRKAAISWICSVLESPLLKIRNVALDDLSRSGDEGEYKLNHQRQNDRKSISENMF